MDLSGLPQFTIEEIRAAAGDPEITLLGRLSHIRGIRSETAWLYRSARASLIGTVTQVPVGVNSMVAYQTTDAALAPELRVGAVYPWIDGSWQAYQVAMVLAGQWEPRTFTTEPARYFRLAGATGWQPVEAPLLEGAEDLGVRPGGWDHEHCELCQTHIGGPGDPNGFVDPEEHWLCRECYERYAIACDVSFVIEA